MCLLSIVSSAKLVAIKPVLSGPEMAGHRRPQKLRGASGGEGGVQEGVWVQNYEVVGGVNGTPTGTSGIGWEF